MADPLLRQWHMLTLIPVAPRKVSAPQLCSELVGRGWRVDVRTVQRDLQKLSSVLPLLCDERSRPFGWSWQAGASVPWSRP